MSYKQIRSLELIFTAACNMKCPYCFIHKNEGNMKVANKEIQDAIIDGSFVANIKKVMAPHIDELTHISLWGGEPTVNCDYFYDLINPLIDYFPLVQEIMFSTNSLLGIDKLKVFFDAMYKMSHDRNRKLKLELQFSIDGPQWINDKNRNTEYITDITLQSINDVNEYLSTLCDELFTVRVFCKPTVSTENMKTIMEHPDGVLGWYKFFHNIQERAITEHPSEYVEYEYLALPTFVIPGAYTNEDGIIFYNFIKEIKKINLDDIPLYKRLPGLFLRYWNHYIASKNEINSSPFTLTCAAGVCDYSMDCKGNFMTCHRVYDNVNMGGLNTAKAKALIETEIAHDEIERDRVIYVSDTYHANPEIRNSMFDALLLAMVDAGEIDKKYLQLEYRKVLHIFAGGMRCFAGEAQDHTASHYIPTCGYIRLLCHGALEEILDYYESIGLQNIK